jgi:hypothetical protein
MAAIAPGRGAAGFQIGPEIPAISKTYLIHSEP